ncbi:tyrosine-type recombinase/integrase [Paraburkholderia fungorum]|uniref:tyrosine-type recombinase/integrase n=1 Tax=Paraburkholderia fungorum TaxID=134537 RepID=UPI00402B96C2
MSQLHFVGRRAEAAGACRGHLRVVQLDDPDTGTSPCWVLTVTGKGSRERTVPVSAATIGALRAHWADRGEDLDGQGDTAPAPARPLLAPLVVPPTVRAQARHAQQRAGYSARGLGTLTGWAIRQIRTGMDGLSPAEHAQLARTSPHALRHTFGTQAAAADVPLDVIQKVLGHASLQTTSIYVQAEQQRMLREVARYHARLADHGSRPAARPPISETDR